MASRGKFIPDVWAHNLDKRDFAGRSSFAQLRWMILAAVLLLAAGCTNFIYNRVDNFAAAYIQDLVTLDDVQSDQLKRWLEQTLQWHRRSELARYREFLEELKLQSAQPQPASTYIQGAERIRSFFHSIAEQTVPEAARLLCTLNAEQADEFVANLHERDQEKRQEREEMSREERTRERTKQLQRQARNWVGRLSEEQKSLIAETAKRLPFSQAQYESRVSWRRALRSQLAQTPQGCKSPAEVERLLLEPERYWTEQYARDMETNRRLSIELLVALDASLTPRQREHVREELNDWTRTVDALLENDQ